MARQVYQGYHQARSAGDLDGTPDVRIMLCMSGFSFDPDAVNLSDGTLDEFDGSGYARYDVGTPVGGYDASADEFRITGDSGAGDEFGATVGPGGEPPSVLVAYLHVDGDPDNDVILGSSTLGTFADGNGGPLGLVLPNGVVLVDQNLA